MHLTVERAMVNPLHST